MIITQSDQLFYLGEKLYAMKRRTFLRRSTGASMAISTLGMGILPNSANSAPGAKSIPIGIQLYTLATVLSEDFEGTLKMLSDTGYQKLEFAGPYYFSSNEEIDNNILIQQMGLKGYGYHNNTPEELRKILDDLGLSAPSAHISLESMDHNLDEAINAAKIIGHEYITIPMMLKPSMDEWKAMADKFNLMGEACRKAGIGFAYHNHSQEFAEMDGEIVMDMLLKRTDPEFVSFELDLFWSTVAGINPADYFKKYQGRFKMLHIKEMAKEMDKPNTDWKLFTDIEKIGPIFSNQTIVGEGIIDFNSIIKAAQKIKVEHYFIESDFPPDPVTFAQKSFENLNGTINQ